MDFSELDQTQVITFDGVEEEDLTDDLDSDGIKKPVAHLKVLLQPGLKEITYPLYEGDNIVGRSQDSCHIWISSKSLSKEHACIQIINNVHMIFDKQSRNKTRRGKLFLQPEVRYELKNKDEIFFADVKCIYLIENEESCLMSPDQPDKPDVLAANTPEKEKLTSEKTLFVAESESEEEDENFQKRIEDTVLSDDESDPDQSCDQEVYYAATQPYGLLGNHDDDDDASNLSEKSSQEQKEEKMKLIADVKSVLKKKDGQVNEPSDGSTAGELNISHLDSDVPCHFSMSTLACDKTVLGNQTSDSAEAAVDDDGPTSHCETVMLTETAEIESSQAKYHQTESNNNKSKSFKLQKRKTEKVETETVSNGDNNGTLVLGESLSLQSNEDEVPAKMARRSSARRGRQQVTTRGRQIKSGQFIVKTLDLEASDSLKTIEKATSNDNLTDLKTCILVEETQESDKSTDNEEDFDVCEPTQAYTMDCNKPTQAYTSGSDEPTQVYPKGLDEPTQVYPKVVEEPTQVYPKGFDEPTQVESLEEPTQVYHKGGLDEPTQVYPKGFDEPTQEDSLDELMQADPKGFEEPTQVYAKDFESSSDTAKDQDETQKFDLLENDATDTHENHEDQKEKVNNEDMVVEDSFSEDDSDLEAESVLKPDLSQLNCEDDEVDDESFSIGDKMLHLDVTKSFEDNTNISPIIEQMKEKSQEVQMKVKSPVKASSSKKLFDATVTSPVKSPYKSALATKRCLTSPTPKHVAFTEDTKKDSQLNLGKSSPSEKMSPQRQACSSASNGHDKEETSTGEVRNTFENPEVVEELKATLEQPDTVGDTPQTTESPPLEMCSSVPKKRGRKSKVKLDSSWDEASSSDTKSKQAETSTGKSSVPIVVTNQTPEKTEDKIADKAVNEGTDGTELISITTESSSLENNSTVQKRIGRKPKVNLDSTELKTASKGAKSKQAKTSTGNSSVQADANQTTENRLENVILAEDKAVGGVQVINKPTYTADETTESPAVENSFSVQKRRGRKPKVKLDSSDGQIASSETTSKQEETSRRASRKSAGRSLFQADPNLTPENRIENVGLTEDKSAGNVEVINERTDDVEVLTTESPTIEIVSAVHKRRGRKPKVKLDSAETETASNDAKSKQSKTTVDESSIQADSNQTPDNRLENVDKSADSVEGEQTSGTEEMEMNTTDVTSIVVEGSSSTEDFKLSATKENIHMSTRRKRVSSHPAYLKDFETATPKASKKETTVSKALKKDSKSKDVESPTATATPKALKKDSKSEPDVETATEVTTFKAMEKDSESNPKVSVEESVDNPKPVQSRCRKSNWGNQNSTVPTQLLDTATTTQKALKESEDLEDFTNISPPKKARITNVPTSKTSLRKSKNLNESTSVTSTKNLDKLDEFPSANAPIDVDKSISTKSTTSPTPKGSLRGQSLMGEPKAQGEDKKVKSEGQSTPGKGQRKNTEQSSQSDSEMSVSSSSSSAAVASSSKKPSSQTKGDKTISSQSLRRSSLCQKPKVMFTGLVDEPGEKIVKDLRGEIATAIQDCTHLVTDKIRRTVKFLSGLSKGIPIVTPLWLENSKRAGTFLDGHKFLVSDAAIEKQYKFSLSASITKAATGGGLLKDYKVHVTKSVTPTPDQMQEILLCAGAVYLKTMPKSASENTIVISCPDDKKLCQPAIKAGIPVVEAEFILTGILRQEVDFKSFSLFTEESTPVEKRKRK